MGSKMFFGAGQQGSAAVPIMAGITAIGAGIYYTSKKTPDVSDEQARHNVGESKRAEGLGGAGVGGNALTGGHEPGHQNPGPKRSEGTTAPQEKLPSGGVGEGVGAGGSNARAVEMTSKSRPGTSSTSSVSSTLQGMFGQGGATAGTGDYPEAKDTRVASNLEGTSTKKNTSYHSDHRNPTVPKGDNSHREAAQSGSSDRESDKGKKAASQTLQSATGHGGANTTEPGEQSQGFRDPRVASNHTETTTKRN